MAQVNRGFQNYFKTAMRSATSAILKGGKIFRYYAYHCVSLIGYLIPLLNAIFPVANVRHAKIVKEEGQMPFARAFGGIDTGNAFGTAMLTFLIKYLIILGGVVVIGLIGGLLFVIGGFIASVTNMSQPQLLQIIFAAPAAIAEVIYVIVMLITYAPAAYIVDSNTNMRATEVLAASAETMRRDGKRTYFLNVFIPMLIRVAYVGLVTAVIYALMQIGNYDVRVWSCVVVGIITLIPYLIFSPVLTLTTAIANNSLYEDIALDPASMSVSTKGVMIKRCSINNSLADKGRDSNLEALFDSAPTVINTAPPDTKYVPPTDRAEKLRVYKEEVAEPTETNESEDVEEVETVQEAPIPEPKSEPVSEPTPAQTVTPAATEEQVVKPAPAPTPVQEQVVKPAPAPTYAQAQPVRPAAAPAYAQAQAVRPAAAPAYAQAQAVNPAAAPTYTQAQVVRPAAAPTYAQAQVVRPAAAPAYAQAQAARPATAPTYTQAQVVRPATAPTPSQEQIVRPAPIPTYTQAQVVRPAPAPTYVQAQPVRLAPAPTYAQAQPVRSATAPTYTQAQVVRPAPAPTQAPAPTYAQAQPVRPAPAPTYAQAQVVRPATAPTPTPVQAVRPAAAPVRDDLSQKAEQPYGTQPPKEGN